MKKKKTRLRLVSLILMLALCVSMFSGINVSAEAEDTEQLTESSELWTPSEESTALSYEGDLPFEELETAVLPEEDNPEIVSDDMIEENGHVNRLWEQEEDMNTVIFQNRDGTKTMYYYGEPVKYKNKDGKVKDKSNKISKTSSGDYTNAENDINTYFPKKIHKNKGIELKYGEYTIEVAPNINGSSEASRQTGHNKYSDPTEYVEYPETFAENISLRYTPTFQGFKEDIILHKYTEQNQFSFILRTNGLSAVYQDNIIYIVDPITGAYIAQINPIYVYDSYTGKKTVEHTHDTYNNETLLKVIEQDEKYEITVIVDSAFLQNEETVYPVYVDPTVNMCQIDVSGTGASKTIQDAPLYTGSNAKNMSHGANPTNYVGYVGSYNGINYEVGRTLIKFPELTVNEIYRQFYGANVTKISLYLYENVITTATQPANIGVYQYPMDLSGWSEYTATCQNSNFYTMGDKITEKMFSGTASGYRKFDLSSLKNNWQAAVNAANQGIILRNDTTESNYNYCKGFASTESQNQPFLTFNYTLLPTGVNISETNKDVTVGDSFNLTANVLPSGANQGIVWVSNDTSVATVSSTGVVQATGAGTTTIQAISMADTSKRATCTVNVSRLKIYQTIETYGWDENTKSPEDLSTDDISENDLKEMDWINWSDFVGTTAQDFRNEWEFMCSSLFATDPLEDVILDMIDHFMSGTGNPYSNLTLTNSAFNHSSSMAYVDGVKSEVDKLIKLNNGNIRALTYSAQSHNSNPLVTNMNNAGIIRPKFDSIDDTLTGLRICINELQCVEISVKSYNASGNNYSGVLTFTFYDHFGLDAKDVEDFGYLKGFRSWYILQHSKTYNGAYKPFVAIMEKDIAISGIIN